jgi:hypothetical protein
MSNDFSITMFEYKDLYSILQRFYGKLSPFLFSHQRDKIIADFILELIDSCHSWNECAFLATP